MIIEWQPDRSKNESIKHQIFKYFIERIASGDWLLGAKLPSERRLSEQLAVNRSTISTVLDELKAEGVLESRGSKGTFVVNNSWSVLSLSNRTNWEKYITNSVHMPNHKIIQKINHYEFKKGIIRLGTGELAPGLFPKDLTDEVMREVTKGLYSLNYVHPLGIQELRTMICNHLKKYSLDVNENQILITSGALQGLHLIALGLLEPGSTVFVEQPSYLKSLHVFQSTGMKLEGIPITEDCLDLENLRSKINKSKSNLFYTIPSFNNPTSITMDQEKREALMELVNEYRIPVIEDDVYRELWIDKEPPMPLKSMDVNGNVLYMGSLSKSFSPGLRIGWLVGPSAVVERLGDIKMQIDYGSSSLSQYFALEWFRGGFNDVFQKRLRDILEKKRDFTLKVLENHFGDLCRWKRPKGGFYIWVELNNEIDMEVLFHEALKHNILINIGSIYDFKKNNAIRISYAYASEEEIEKGIEILSQLIRKI
ncbi:MAG: PLP-dependent aminotransferase family protein [Clostridiales bacterium]|nr:PLP-dependent aminotransferase family protein [Clostridiales bacterium]